MGLSGILGALFALKLEKKPRESVKEAKLKPMGARGKGIRRKRNTCDIILNVKVIGYATNDSKEKNTLTENLGGVWRTLRGTPEPVFCKESSISMGSILRLGPENMALTAR